MPKDPDGLSFFHDQFSQHPQSIAERLRQRALCAIFRALESPAPAADAGPGWRDLTENSTAEEIEAAAKNSFHESPPPRGAARLLRAEYRILSVLSSGTGSDGTSSSAETTTIAGCRPTIRRGLTRLVACCRSRTTGRLKLAWRPAADSLVHPRGPDHIHTETTVDGHGVHIDRLERRLHSPGRGWKELRIFVDNVLAGRAGLAGCSLGAGGSDLPAIACIGRSKVITVDIIESIAVPIVELWERVP
jgi:hypothetical protein